MGNKKRIDIAKLIDDMLFDSSARFNKEGAEFWAKYLGRAREAWVLVALYKGEGCDFGVRVWRN